MKRNRYWLILLVILLLGSSAAALFMQRAPGSVARIYQDGVLIKSLDLSDVTEPHSFTVEHGSGENVILIERGRIKVAEATCPDLLCVGQGWLRSARPIVCLPHRLVVTLNRQSDNGPDAVTG